MTHKNPTFIEASINSSIISDLRSSKFFREMVGTWDAKDMVFEEGMF
jgi:hypothetical protein